MGTAAEADGTDVFVVVREAGERTAGAVRELAGAELGPDRVTSIREVPFAAALRRGLELGVEAGRAWTLCLDADVLPRPGGIAELVAAAEAVRREAPRLLGASGHVADTLLGQVRVAGNSLYRTEHLPRTLASGEFHARKRRPESFLKKMMAKDGHPWRTVAPVIGLHDCEQYFRDVFRTVFAHNRKHGRFMPYAARYWARRAAADEDHRVALWSLRIAEMIDAYAPRPGARDDENVAIDVRQFGADLDAILRPAGMAEKAPLAPGAISGAEIARRVGAFEVSPEFARARPWIDWQQRLELRRRGSPLAARVLGPAAVLGARAAMARR